MNINRFLPPSIAILIASVFLPGNSFCLCAQAQTNNVTQADIKLKFENHAKHYLLDSTTKGMLHEFRQTSRSFGHLTRPWEVSERKSVGKVRIDQARIDLGKSTQRGAKTTETFTAYTASKLYRLESSGQSASVTKNEHTEYLFTTCRFTPAFLIQHALSSNTTHYSMANSLLIASGNHQGIKYDIFFSVAGEEASLQTINLGRHHEMWGDQLSEIKYESFRWLDDHVFPSQITETNFGKVTSEVKILSSKSCDDQTERFISIPNDYKLAANEETNEEVEVDKYSDNITFLHVTHEDSRTTVVEFDEFLVVIDAPKTSRNGKLIIDKIKELEFGKPIKYFAFGHHHPHYLGGVRPFIANGTTILTTKKIMPYLNQIVVQQHTMQPDELQNKPSPLKTLVFEDQTEVTDGQFTMKVFDIGLDRSKHTIDYLLFYFPKEKMVLQGDGIWLRPNESPGARTIGIYEAIEDLKLDVVDCIQGWPTQNYGVPTKIKFADLEKAVNTADQDTEQKNETDKQIFASLQGLVGFWEHESKQEAIEFRMISRDSVLVERWIWPDREGMTLYHMDGEKLMATHYCPVGNQPRLLFDSTTDEGKHLFKFDSVTNLPDRTKSHCVEFWLQPKGMDKLLRSETYSSGKGLDVSGATTYKRVQTKPAWVR